jgi:hypothetical protein
VSQPPRSAAASNGKTPLVFGLFCSDYNEEHFNPLNIHIDPSTDTLTNTPHRTVHGRLKGPHKCLVVASTVRQATSYVASSFWKCFKPSPFHLEDHKAICPTIRQLLGAFKNLDLPRNHQKAITPKFHWVLYRLRGAGSLATQDSVPAVAAQLAILASLQCTLVST